MGKNVVQIQAWLKHILAIEPIIDLNALQFSWEVHALGRADLQDLEHATQPQPSLPQRRSCTRPGALRSLCRCLLNELADVGRAGVIHSAEASPRAPNKAVCPILKEAARI